MSGAATQAAPAPQTGMRRIPIPLESYEHANLPLSAKRVLNMYAEKQPDDARAPVALIPAPGLIELLNVGTGPIKVINSDLPGYNYVVSGSQFYRVKGGVTPGTFVATFLGDIGEPVGDPVYTVTVAVGAAAAVVCVPPNAFTCGHLDSDTLNQLGGTFPGASSVAFMDGYFAFSDPVDVNRWFLSALFDPTNFDALDFAYSDALPNAIIRIIGHRGEFWMMGLAGHEVWYDSGNADFPFRRRPGAVIRKGVSSAVSIAQGDGSVWWVGLDGIIYRSNGYLPDRISTHAVEAILAKQPGGANGVQRGLFYVQDGHSFYSATFGERTFVYDAATQAWAERSSSTDGASAWRANCAASMPSFLALGDSQSGKLFAPQMGDAAEDGIAVIRSATLPPLYAATRRAFCARAELEMQTPLYTDDVTLEWSDDGGVTWGPSRTLLPTTVVSPRRRVYTTRLGSFRQRVFRVSSTASFSLYAVDADISAGAS
jgi:hypothetical protein